MATVDYFVSSTATALILAACGGNALADDANAVRTADKIAHAAPTKVALATLEKSAYAAWKSKDAKFWDTFLADKFVGWGSSGRLDKASATMEYTGADCEIKRFALSDEQIKPLGRNAALITHKTAVDGTCKGQKVPANSWVASVYVRDGDTWKAIFHAEAPVVDPKSPPAEPVDKKEAPKEGEAEAADRDARTDAILAVEKAVWEAWREHDADSIGRLTAGDISFINIFGTHLATKAEALKNWGGAGCDVKSVGVTDAVGTMLSPTVGILTFKGAADGACYGQKVGPIWGTSVYVKDGDTWKWTFGINVPAR
jgi:ketosteroid isomerase-like protein